MQTHQTQTTNTLKHGNGFLTLSSTPPLPPATIRWQKVPPSEESRARRVRFALPEQNLGERPHNAAMVPDKETRKRRLQPGEEEDAILEEEMDLRREHTFGARWVLALAAGRLDSRARC